MNINLWFCLALIIPVAFLIYILAKKRYYIFSIYLIFLTFVTTYSFLTIKNYNDSSYNTLDNIAIMGKVESINTFSNYTSSLILSDCYVAFADGTYKQLDANINVTINGDTTLQIKLYDQISCTGDRLSGIDAIENNELKHYYIKYKIRYKIKVTSDSIVVLKNVANNIEKFREYNRQLLISQLGERMGNLAYTSLYGDKNYTEQEILDEFKYTGVAHIFCVSGLHISLIAFLIDFLLKKLKINNKLSFVITGLLLFVYCLLCSFNSPVVRASIMTMTMLLAQIFVQRYDSLNAISLAGCILLLINPLNTFDAGFQMSFFAIFGILMCANLFSKIKIKNVFLNKICSLLIVSFSAQIGLLPILINTFSYIATYSIISNLIVVPLFSLFFVILFVVNIFVVIFPFLSFLYFIPKAILYCTVFVSHLVYLLPYNLIYLQQINFTLTSLYYVNMYFISKYVVVRSKMKVVFSLLLMSVIVTIYVLQVVNFKQKQTSFVIAGSSNALGSTYQTQSGDFILINPCLFAQTQMLYDDIEKIDAVVIIDDYEDSKYEDIRFLNMYNPTYILAYNHSLADDIINNNLKYQFLYDKTKIDFNGIINIECIFYNNFAFAFNFKIINQSIVFIDGSITKGSALESFIQTNLDFEINYANILNTTNETTEFNFWNTHLKNCNNILLPSTNNFVINF